MLLNEIDDIDFIEPMRLCTVDILYHEDDGIIMLEKESQSLMISMNDMNKFKTLFPVLYLENYDLYNVKQKEIVDLLMTDYHNGYGYLLEGYLINELLKQKKVPYCQVIEGNEASLALQRKLHMKISSRYSYWVFDD